MRLNKKDPPYKIINTGGFEWQLFVLVVGLMCFGIVMVYSASCYFAESAYGNKYYYVTKQVIGVALGVITLICCSKLDYHVLDRLKIIILLASVALLLLVFVPGIGVENYGAKRWIKFPIFTLQSSEIAKFGYIIFCSGYMAKNHKNMGKFKYLLPILGVGGLICILIMLEPNMSVTMCVALTMLCLMFIGGTRIKHFVYIIIPLACAVPLLIIAEPYRCARLMAFLNPWESPLEEGYQLIQSLYALGSGGVFGVGLFNSRQKFLFLPFAESDFIFSVIGEELGLVGCICVLFVFVIIIYKAIKIAQNASDRLGCYLSSGIACIIAIQVLINVAVVTGSIPPTGLPLPFVSAGSSSLIAFCAGVGIIINVKKQSMRSFL